ncbi:MAG: N-6 DNA methylase [Malacoplasma sp.]|nr:N-6 DNA methylase [Malacoplasma sp.]
MDHNIKDKIDALWKCMEDNQMTDAKTNITQITYLLFIKMLDDKQMIKESNARSFGNTEIKDPVFKEGIYRKTEDENGQIIEVTYDDLRWHNFIHYETDKRFTIVRDSVFKFISELNLSENLALYRFMKRAKLEIPSAEILERIVTRLNDKDLNLDNKQIKGDVYEYLLEKLNKNKSNGQFRTPRHIVRMMVELMKPKLGDKICDPAMGTAGFLMESAKYINEHQKDDLNNKSDRYIFNNDMFYGYDTDPDMLRIGSMNMYFHDVSGSQIYQKNSLTDENDDKSKFDLILANPPFSAPVEMNDLSKSLKDIVPTKKTELLFIALFLRSLKIGGRCASIVPVGVLNNTSEMAYTTIRKELVKNQKLRAIIYMPSGVFKPYSGVQTAIIIFDKTDNGGTDKVWLYNMENDGLSLDDKRSEIKENDIPNILSRFGNDDENNRTAYDKSFFITKEEIVANNYVLSWNKYQKKHIEKKIYRTTQEIFDSLTKNEVDYFDNLKSLSKDYVKDCLTKILSSLDEKDFKEIVDKVNIKKQLLK